MTLNTLCLFGTRPEAIKMAPIIRQLNAHLNISNQTGVTGQHQQMLDSILAFFNITPDFNLKVMVENQDLSELTARILMGLNAVFQTSKPDLILVHGDTTTAFVASLSAYYHHIPIAHVEAGLRTGALYSPWPEEGNRKIVGVLADLHFAPTVLARQNLVNEGVASDKIFVTGNTVVDALQDVVDRIEQQSELSDELRQQFPFLNASRKMILVTAHRRENFGAGLERICQALIEIAYACPDIDIVYPVHLNPNIHRTVNQLLNGVDNIHLIPPVDYLPFVYLLKSAYLILTDSGGIQEEAMALGKPVLVMRENTERAEAIQFGGAHLVGTNVQQIVSHVLALITHQNLYEKMIGVKAAFGDGRAAARIIDIIEQRYCKNKIKCNKDERVLC